MRFAMILFGGACVVLATLGCGQQDVVLPEQSGGAAGECGPWYPAGGDAGVEETGSDDGDSDNEGEGFAYEIGSTLPCFVWESVRVGPTGPEPNTYINMGEVYLQSEWGAIDDFQAKWGAGVVEPNWILLVLVASVCPSCESYVNDIMDHRADFESRGVAIVGVARSYDLDNTVDLTFEEAEDLLMHDGFEDNTDLHRTNDEERYLGANATMPSGYPQMGLIRIEDMKVIDKTVDPTSDPELAGAQAILDLIDANTL
jgi:hypothetical protein